jgi:hypothetical protein
LKQNHKDTSKDENAFRTAVIGHFKSESLEYDIRVQLWTNEDSQPLEDASVEGSQEDSPYITVAGLRIPSQAAYSTERLRYFDENMQFRPGHSLEAHRPLGALMRARLQVYPALSAFRHRNNGIEVEEAESIEQIPA